MARFTFRSIISGQVGHLGHVGHAAALALICGGILAVPAAMAQQDAAKNGRELAGGLDQPLHDGLPGANVSMLFSKTELGRSYELKMEGGKLTGKVDGEELPPERIRRTGSKVEFLGKDGEVLTEFGVGMGGLGDMPRGSAWRFQNRGPGGVTATVPGTPGWQGERLGALSRGQAAAPPVMLGITMSEWGDGEGVEVDSVVDGLPASKAGVKEGDIIKSLAGKKVTSREDIMAVLKTLKAGEAVDILVLRDEKEETLRVEPAAFDRERLGGVGGAGGAVGGPEEALADRLMERWGNQGQEWYDEAVKQLQESMAEIKDSKELGEAQEHAQEAMQQALAALKQAHDAMGKNSQLWLQGVPGGGRTIITPRDAQGGGPEVLTLRQGEPLLLPGGPAGPDLARQMERLAEQLERLGERLDRMEERLHQPGAKKE